MIKGLAQLQKQLAEAQVALQALDGHLGTVEFDPHDPGSIDQAISSVHALIDSRLGEYESNPIIAPLIEQAKASYRDQIIEKAAASRLSTEDDE